MMRRYYTCEVVDSTGCIVGSRIVWIWIWGSPYSAYDLILSKMPASKAPINFRRIK